MDFSVSALTTGASTAAATAVGSMQALAQNATVAAQAIPHTIPAAVPPAVSAGAASSAQLVSDIAVLEKPARAMAAGAPKLPMLHRVAGFLGKALPIVTIAASGMAGAKIVSDKGAGALITSKDGRGAVLGALGGALLLVPHPATQIAAAGVLGTVAVNHFGGLDKLDTVNVNELGKRRPASS